MELDHRTGHRGIVTSGWRDIDDGQLWKLARDDPRAFGELFERHSDAVYNHCFRRTASWSAAEDLTSVVFLEAWRRRRDVKLAGESILPWLLAVANNAVRNRDRALRRHRRLLAKLPSSVTQPDPAEDVVARIDDERRMTQVLAAFRQLTRHEQDVLALCGWAGVDYARAAVSLGVPVGTVRSRLSRARDHLRGVAAQADASATSPAPRCGALSPPRPAVGADHD